MSTIKARKEAAIHEAITGREPQMTYDNEAIVRNAYHTAEGNVLDIPGWIGSFTEDGVFNNVSGEASYRGEHLKDVVITFAKMFPDVHHELYQVNVMGDERRRSEEHTSELQSPDHLVCRLLLEKKNI